MKFVAPWIATIAWIITVGAQAPASPGIIAGRVITVDGSHEAPMRRAVVTASADDPMNHVSAVTDDDGRFMLEHLAPGGYFIAASKAPFLTATYGATLPGLPGRRVTLAPGQRIDDLRIVLARGAVISGTIRAPDDQPLPACQVVVRDAQAGAGAAAAAMVTTDDRGEYRAYGLRPGTYTVAAVPPARDQTGLTVGGRAEMDELFSRLSQGAAGIARAGSAPPTSARPPTYGYARVFYPGTPVERDAAVLSLQPSDERTGVDITIALVRLAHLSGSLMPVDGRPVASLRLMLAAPGTTIPLHSVMVGATGDFTFDDVAPGRYVIVGEAPPKTAGESRAFATTTVTVDGADIDGLTVPIHDAMRVSGRVRVDAAAREAIDFSAVSVGVTSLDSADLIGPSSVALAGLTPVPVAKAQADGSFAIEAVLPGRYVPIAKGIPTGWWLRSAMSGGLDLLDAPLAMTTDSGNVSDVVLTLTDLHSQLSGVLVADGGAPVPDYVVVVFPEDRTQWIRGGRRLRLSLTGVDGGYSFEDLPGGSYRLAALSGLPTTDWQTAAFLDLVSPLSRPVNIVDGQHISLSLRLGSGESHTK